MNEIPFVYEIRYSQRAKRLRLVVTPEKVEVVAPKRTAGADIRPFWEDGEPLLLISVRLCLKRRIIREPGIVPGFGKQ